MGLETQINPGANILTVNSGSSSIKVALFRTRTELERTLEGKFQRVGLPGGEFSWKDNESGSKETRALALPNHAACVPHLIELLEARNEPVAAIGHRVVHGGPRYVQPQPVTDEMLTELRRLSPFVPDHLPGGLLLIEAMRREYKDVPQIACFDTAFHHGMPRLAKLLPLPRRFDAKGIQRYGFHGLSYAYLMEQLAAQAGDQAAKGRVILAHLGNGASMAAVHDGKCLDTTMGFTPTAGLVMSTRPGDLDPGLFTYLARVEGMGADEFNRMINAESGLLGISETSSDMRDLCAREASDPRAAEAVAMFCYHARKWIGALAAVLGGLDTLVFSGGIGENSTPIRQRICAGLEHLGIEIDSARNEANDPILSKQGSRATVRMIRTDEERYIAESVTKILSLSNQPGTH
jgi:acetate kinase